MAREGGFLTIAPPNLPDLKLRLILSGVWSDGGRLLRQYANRVELVCVFALLFPLLIFVILVPVLLARVFGVPLFAPPSFITRLAVTEGFSNVAPAMRPCDRPLPLQKPIMIGKWRLEPFSGIVGKTAGSSC